MAIQIEPPQQEKKSETISIRLGCSEYKDLTQTAMACGFDELSDYIRASLFFSKPILLQLRGNPAFILSLIAEMVKGK